PNQECLAWVDRPPVRSSGSRLRARLRSPSRLPAAGSRARSIRRRHRRNRRLRRRATGRPRRRRPRPRRRPRRRANAFSSTGSSTEHAMPHSAYRDGVLHAEAVNLATLAAAVGTPFYCYSTATLERHYRVFAGAFADVPALVCYAMKANSNQAVIRTLARLGAGADVVSEGELNRARAAGIPPDKIMFSGIGKTARELALAVDEGILCVNVESEPELELLSAIARAKGRSVDISLRVNPDIDPRTHAKIATGKAENKF